MIKINPAYNRVVRFTGNEGASLEAQNEQNSVQNSEPTFEKAEKKKTYNDPLMKWPVRGLAFTNDIGAAVMDIAPKLGTFLWYPAMMYFGADIYDKYRNNKDAYDPNAKRGFEQAVFQALASVVFPIVAVHTGQKTASIAARKTKTKLSLQAQEESTKFLLDFISRRKLKDYEGKKETFKKEFKVSLDNYIDETSRNFQNKNIVSKFFSLVFGGRHPEEMGKEGNSRRQNIHKFMETKIDNMFEIREKLIANENTRPDKLSENLFDKFKDLKAKYLKDPDFKANAKDLAIKDILNEVESSNIFKTKLKKTVGGFIMLGLLIKPIDMFVENVIMKKYVEPGLDYLQETQIKNFKLRNLKSQN